jgi:electron transport complex protein RnfA
MSWMPLVLGAVLVDRILEERDPALRAASGVGAVLRDALWRGLATTLVLTLSLAVAWTLQTYILVPLQLAFLDPIVFLLLGPAVVGLLQRVLSRSQSPVCRVLSASLPGLPIAFAVLGLALLMVAKGATLGASLGLGLVPGLLLTLVLLALAGIGEETRFANVPAPLRGWSIVLITAGLLTLSLAGFAGLLEL